MSCSYPQLTRQAKDFRKAQRIAQKQLKETIKVDSTSMSTSKPDSAFNSSSQLTQQDSLSQSTLASIDSLQEDNTPVKPSVSVISPDSSRFSFDPDSSNFTVPSMDSSVAIDTIINDTIFQDSIQLDTNIRTYPLVVSPDSLDLPVQYESIDSMIYDIASRKVFMYGDASVFYEQYVLQAGYIEFDFSTNIAMATCLVDSNGNEYQCPFFDDKNQQFSARRIEFNFRSKKGKVYDASTQQGDGYLVSKATKFISTESSDDKDNIIYSKGCIYTTCDHETPHFGIRASSAKIIPNKLIVVGPSYLEIMGTPTPLVLPFGFFPLTKNKKSGLIISPDFDFSPTLGPGIRGNGFYLSLSDHLDLRVTGDFYMRGSIRAYANSNYKWRYKSNGTVSLGYTRIVNDEPNTPDYSLQQSFNLSWSHAQSPKAHPSQSFTASVNFGTSDYFQNTFNEADAVLQATFNSSIGYTKRFLGTPFSLSARVSHSQNTQTRVMTLNVPTLSLNMNQIFPFKRKNKVGKQRWYERIGFSYNMSGRNTIVSSDTSLFTPDGFRDAIDNMNYDITHSPRLNMSFKLFDVINIQPNINYTQRWFFYKNIQTFDPTPTIDTNGIDTLTFGSVNTSRDYGLFTTHQFSASINMNTQIFATGTFNILGLHQIRAIFSPNVGFTWRPDYESSYDYYYDSVQYDSRYPDQLRQYNHFAFIPPSGQTGLLTFSLNARFDAKIKKSRSDTLSKGAFKKVSLIPNFTISGNYNIMADSLHLSPISLNTYTTLFKKINVRVTATFDPYTANRENNTRLNTFAFTETGELLRFTNVSFNASTSFNSKDIRSIFLKKNEKDNYNKGFELLNNVSVGYNFVISRSFVDGIDSVQVTAHQLSFSGTINLSKGWNIRVGRIGYDFKNNRVTYPDFTFSRDLHCWQMGLSWQPERQTWGFFLRVKPGSLSFLNVPVNKEFYDVF